MKVSGFTIIRNALKYDFPVIESISSILPICDEFVVAVGKSEDDTYDLIESIDSPKIKIIETVWDETLMGQTGSVLASETNKALSAVAKDSDWAFYIQSDEIVHENDLPNIQSAMDVWKDDARVDGLLFKYLHFYGSYDYLASSPHWYGNEIRIIRTDRSIYSYRDAQGFRKGENQKLNVCAVNANMYHYGWVRHPSIMQEKRIFHLKWQNESIEDKELKAHEFDYTGIDLLEKYQGTHPAIITSRIKAKNWLFDFDLSKNRLSPKNKIKKIAKKYFGIELGYKNYRLLR